MIRLFDEREGDRFPIAAMTLAGIALSDEHVDHELVNLSSKFVERIVDDAWPDAYHRLMSLASAFAQAASVWIEELRLGFED